MKLSTIFIITLSILIPSGLFTFYMKNTRSFQGVTINFYVNQELDKENNKNIVISEESIKKLENTLKQSNAIPSEERLLVIYEREREHYILLISILTIILTIVSTYFIFSRFVEKEEYVEIRATANEMNNKYEKILNELKFNLIVQDIIIKTDLFNKNLTLINDETMTIVKNTSDFEKYVFDQFNEIFEGLELYSHSSSFPTIYAPTINYIAATIKHGYAKQFLTEDESNIPNGAFFKNQINHIKILFGKSKYSEFRNYINLAIPNLKLP
ncbi:hypothetical protein EHQ31_18740 [Leptospira montravelensis]|uniref:Uncharacterized protein n=1 Tax=Leptospira montravelensis TaxID=2484961 RepID=A0ABY2LPF8_9LEPT|nr:hypothetical protein [Leptospira montravelensis]TGK82697.1 hypothetical protein EHQ19_08440 [Leptospira montravelensis]TGK95002.1 hypothetical protein EHQ31_18740 [Leptospira montravelensis]